MRQKRCLDSTVLKYVAFLEMLREKQADGQSLKYLVSISKINKSVIRGIIALKIIEHYDDNTWEFKLTDISKSAVLELLNYLLELSKKEIVTPIAGLDDETKVYIKDIRDHLINTHAKQNNGLDGLKTPLLNKELNQVQQTNGNTLFTQIESEQDKKFDLLKAVAGGIYQGRDFNDMRDGYVVDLNELIINATDDLFNKFFKVK